MIAAALAVLRFRSATDPALVELTADDLDELWLRWLRNFGYRHRRRLARSPEPTMYDKVRRDIATDLAEAAAALCWLTIRRGLSDRREQVSVARLRSPLRSPTDSSIRPT